MKRFTEYVIDLSSSQKARNAKAFYKIFAQYWPEKLWVIDTLTGFAIVVIVAYVTLFFVMLAW